MEHDDIIFDAGELAFEQRVVEASRDVPVAVDYWAAWCAPCRSLAPILEKVVREYRGAIRLAKVDTEKNRELASSQGIRSLPTVHLYKQGKVVDAFSGVYPESRVREFLSPHVVRESDTIRSQAETLRQSGKAAEAIALLRQAMLSDPQNHRIVIDLADALFATAAYEDAASALDGLPGSEQQAPPAKNLYTRLYFAKLCNGAPGAGELSEAIQADPRNLEARLQLAARNVTDGDYEAAIEQLIDIIRIEKSYRDDAARRSLVSLFEFLGGDHPLVSRYRPLMAAALY